MSSVRSEDGFTLIELIMVIIIFGIITSVAIPKFLNLRDEANNARCAANRGAINSAIATVYSTIAIQNPSQANWLSNATIASLDDSMFATGQVPVCPTGGDYTLNMGQITCSLHGT